MIAALAAGLVVVIAAAALAGARFLGPRAAPLARGGTGTAAGPAGAVPEVFGVPTVTAGCPAAAVAGAGARCPSAPECWNGIVEISGDTTAQGLPCDAPHDWETFAIALLPPAVSTSDAALVAADPTVRAVCSLGVLLRSRQAAARRIPAGAWDIEVLPPDEAAFDSGARAYRCLAGVPGGAVPRAAQFTR